MSSRIIVPVLAAGFSIGLMATAWAADIAPAYAPMVSPFSWTGLYIGGNAGLALQNASGTSNFIDTADGSSNPQSDQGTSSGFIGGAQVGYNWQVAPNWVLGLEGDWDAVRTKYSFCRQTDITSAACQDTGDGFESIASQTNWLATARGRVGVTLDRVMFYGTGGAAWGNIKTTESLNCSSLGCGAVSLVPVAASATFTQTRVGWVGGLGVEGMLDPNWSIKAEWLHVDLGNMSNTLSTIGDSGGVPPPTVQSAVWSRDETFDIFRVGVNYKLYTPR